jgi:hypothetical protein
MIHVPVVLRTVIFSSASLSLSLGLHHITGKYEHRSRRKLKVSRHIAHTNTESEKQEYNKEYL